MSSWHSQWTKTRLLVVLRNRNFFLVWQGQLVSQIGSQFQLLALQWLVVLSGSPATMATVRVIAMLPRLIFGLVSGVVADRYDRRKIMIVSDLLRMVLAVVFGLLVHFQLVQDWHIYVAAALFGLAWAFFEPAYAALIPNLVSDEDLVAANSATATVSQFAQIAGPAIGGILIAVIGLSGNFFVNAISFLISAVALFWVRGYFSPQRHLGSIQAEPTNPSGRDGRRHFGSDLQTAFAFIANHQNRGLLWIVGLFAVSNLAFATLPVLLPFFVRETLQAGAIGLGMLGSAFAIGLLTGNMIFGIVGRISSEGFFFFVGHVLEGLLLTFFSLTTSFTTALALYFLFGLVNGPLNVLFLTLGQKLVPDQLRGRIFSMAGLLNVLALLVGYGLSGYLPAFLDVSLCFTISGLMLTIVAAVGLVIPSVRQLRACNPPPLPAHTGKGVNSSERR